MQTPIVPVAVFPSTANTLSIRGVGPVDDSGCPNYLYELQNVQEATPAIPAVPAVPAVPATDDTPEVPEIPEVPSVAATYSTVTLASGNCAMTAEQWSNWGKLTPDEEYQLSCISSNLGLILT